MDSSRLLAGEDGGIENGSSGGRVSSPVAHIITPLCTCRGYATDPKLELCILISKITCIPGVSLRWLGEGGK